MTIENTFEFVNARELRRRFLTALQTGQRKLTDKEFADWAPSIERKIQEIDEAGEDFFKRLAHDSFPSVTVYVTFLSSAMAFTPVQPTVTSSTSENPYMLTGVFPEVVAPSLFR